MYESPISISQEQILNYWSRELNKKLETQIIETIQLNYHIDVNKEELIKALQYDREQYEKGCQDGKADMQKKGRWLINSDGYYPYCSQCKYEPKEMTRYCPNCGVEMNDDI